MSIESVFFEKMEFINQRRKLTLRIETLHVKNSTSLSWFIVAERMTFQHFCKEITEDINCHENRLYVVLLCVCFVLC